MANLFQVSNDVAKGMADAITTKLDAGTAAVINIYSGTPPADPDASLSGNTLLAQLTHNATSYGAAADANPGGRITANAITGDTSADATGTASFYRQLTQNAGTVCTQGTVGTSAADMILNTVALTAGSAVNITSATITVPEGP